MDRKIIKIFIILACITTFASCSTFRNLQTDTYFYFKPRLDKKPYAAIKISRDWIKEIPSEILVNDVKIPDSLLNNNSTIYITIHRYKSIYVVKCLKDFIFNKQTLDFDYEVITIDTVQYSVKNKLEVSIKLNNENYYFDIDLLKGRYIWFMYYYGNKSKKLSFNRGVIGFIDDIWFPW